MSKRLRCLTIFSILSFASLAYANQSSTELDQSVPKFKASIGATVTTNAYNGSSVEKSTSMDFSINPSYTFDNEAKLSAIFWGNKDLTGAERKWSWYDSYISLSKNLYKRGEFSVTGIARGYIPLSEKSKDLDYLQTAAWIAPSMTYTPKPGKTSINFRPSFKKNFHEYKTSLNSKSNTSYSTTARVILTGSISDMFSVNLYNYYIRSTTYGGNTKDTYRFIQELAIAATDSFSVSLGHDNSGSPLAANGVDTEINVFNEKSSTYYMTLTQEF